jgi:hypothetical protein
MSTNCTFIDLRTYQIKPQKNNDNTMKASLSASDHASCLVSSDLRSLVPIIEFTMKSIRRDEVARPYGVSESVKNTFSKIIKNNLCLTALERRRQPYSYEENQALKILKRIFGYFLGASKKLPAQLFPELKSGIKVGNTKRLNGTYRTKTKKRPEPLS